MKVQSSETVSIANPLDIMDWDDQMAKLPGTTFFHTKTWCKTIHESYGYLPYYLVTKKEGKVSGLLPIMEVDSIVTGRRGVTLPFSDYCLPVFEDETTLEQLLNFALSIGNSRNWKFLEVRGTPISLDKYTSLKQHYVHKIPLADDPVEVFSKFRKSTKQNINKAVNAGLKVSFSNDRILVKEFYRLHCLNRKKIGVPPQPISFFRQLYTNLISQNHGHFALVTLNDQLVTAGINFYFNNEVVFKYVANNYQFQAYRPNNLLVWEMVKFYSEKGFKKICFGRTDKSNSGLRQFKRGFGTVESMLEYYRFDLNGTSPFENNSNTNQHFRTIFQHLPVSALKLIGNIGYKHVG